MKKPIGRMYIKPQRMTRNFEGFNQNKKTKSFFKKFFFQMMISMGIGLLVVGIKSVSLPISNTVCHEIKMSLNDQVDIKNSIYEMVHYAKALPHVPDKVIQTMNEYGILEDEDKKSQFCAPVQGIVISDYGESIDPISHKKFYQRGVDIGIDKRQAIKSITDGEVVEVGKGDSLGKYIKVEHDKKIFSIYSNCSDIHVQKGQKVSKGESMGNISNGSQQKEGYLHFELWKDGEVVDPTEYISFSKKIL